MSTLRKNILSFYIGTPREKSSATCYDAVETALKVLGIYSPLTMLCAMAQVRVETGDFTPKREKISELKANLDYGGRYGTPIGDGYKYRGANYLQHTFKGNWDEFGMTPDNCLDVFVGAIGLAYFFKSRKVHIAANKKDWLKARKLVNGVNRSTGLPNGWVEFQSIVKQFMDRTQI